MRGCSFSAKAISVLYVSLVPSRTIFGHSFDDTCSPLPKGRFIPIIHSISGTTEIHRTSQRQIKYAPVRTSHRFPQSRVRRGTNILLPFEYRYEYEYRPFGTEDEYDIVWATSFLAAEVSRPLSSSYSYSYAYSDSSPLLKRADVILLSITMTRSGSRLPSMDVSPNFFPIPRRLRDH